eukprot:TRINITY_DN7905_c0_g1_i1.p1 TRINITY_DN7905_c0_g1~~TRINITY_DN7905_c0_g1_i1.p1  ORF type:complete len:166 (-),score=34.56 TRINITY_DN7905_c0_g1_i1:62-559(-)
MRRNLEKATSPGMRRRMRERLQRSMAANPKKHGRGEEPRALMEIMHMDRQAPEHKRAGQGHKRVSETLMDLARYRKPRHKPAGIEQGARRRGTRDTENYFGNSDGPGDLASVVTEAECAGLLHQLQTLDLSLIHISEPTRLLSISYAVFCLKKKKKDVNNTTKDS